MEQTEKPGENHKNLVQRDSMDSAIDLVRRQLNQGSKGLGSRFIRLQRLDCDRGQEVPVALPA